MPSRDTNDVAGLLEHAEWVRVLATRLVREDADDAVQDLWLAALRAPPDSNRPARPWLARVLVNAARKRFRDDTTRQKNEAALPLPETESAEALVGRAHVQHRLVEHVLKLDEPFRQTVLLRFFEGLSSAEIAEQLQLPAGTVRWRLKVALDRLRASLDETNSGDREAWRLACAPLLLPTAGPWLTAGVAFMDKKIRFAVIAACLLLLGMLGWSLPSSRAVETKTTSAENVPTSPVPSVAAKPIAVPVQQRLAPKVTVIGAATPDAPASAPTTPTASASSNTENDAMKNSAHDAGTRFTLDRDGIRGAMRSAIPSIKDCYESWLPMHPGLGGTIITTFTIDTDDAVEGRISQLAVADAGIGHVPLEGCILSSLADLRFDPPLNGPLNVTYPVVLSATDGGPR